MRLFETNSMKEIRFPNRGEFCYQCYLSMVKEKIEEGVHLTVDERDKIKQDLYDNTPVEQVFVIKDLLSNRMEKQLICRKCINVIADKLNKVNNIKEEVNNKTEQEVTIDEKVAKGKAKK